MIGGGLRAWVLVDKLIPDLDPSPRYPKTQSRLGGSSYIGHATADDSARWPTTSHFGSCSPRSAVGSIDTKPRQSIPDRGAIVTQRQHVLRADDPIDVRPDARPHHLSTRLALPSPTAHCSQLPIDHPTI